MKINTMSNRVIKTTWKETKNYINGIFTLNDKTKTKFQIDKKSGAWEQWGNNRENLCISVPKVEALTYTFLYDDN
jgi:hypothetical protein